MAILYIKRESTEPDATGARVAYSTLHITLAGRTRAECLAQHNAIFKRPEWPGLKGIVCTAATREQYAAYSLGEKHGLKGLPAACTDEEYTLGHVHGAFMRVSYAADRADAKLHGY